MRPSIQVCDCGKVRRVFNEKVISSWLVPNESLNKAIKSGTYKKQPNKCEACKETPGATNMLLPVRER